MLRISTNKSILKSEKGQAMPYLLICMVILVISWAMIVNIAKLTQERIMMQNAADNAALSIAVYKARVLNELGYLNFLIACTLRDGFPGFSWGTLREEKPFFGIGGIFNYYGFGDINTAYSCCPQSGSAALPMLFWNSQKYVASIFDVGHGGCSGRDWGFHNNNTEILKMRAMVKSLILIQDSIRLPFPGLAVLYANEIAKRQQINANGDPCGADLVWVDPLYDPSHNSLSLGLERNKNGIYYYSTASACFSWVPVWPIDPDGEHGHVFWSLFQARENQSWLYADKDKFHKTGKVFVHAIKNGNSESLRGYPILGKWIGIEWPTIETNAAAAVYNRDGPMFTLEHKGGPSDDISPVIDAYIKAKNGGWDAHLVPIGKVLKH